MRLVGFPSGAKARASLSAVFGTTEVMPCYKTELQKVVRCEGWRA